jgi:serine/threonine-protein kinase
VKHIGRYQVKGLLGTGGMGRVYKVLDPELGAIRALKHLDPDETLEMILGADELARRFREEARTMAGLRHPAIAEVLDAGEHQGRPFFVMQYYCVNLGVLLGEDYDPAVPARGLRLDTGVDYVLQVLSGLARMHDASLVHRDLKPFNVMVTDRDRVRLIDFGLSKLRGERRGDPETVKIGTPYYTAPELEADPESDDPRSDLYSVGVMLWRMCTTRLPAENPGEYRSPSSINPALDEDFDILLARAVAPEPGDRFQTADEMARAVRLTFQDWQRETEEVCVLAAEPAGQMIPETPLRSSPLKVHARQGPERLGLDWLWRPARPVANDFATLAPDLILDSTTGLVWQQGGSRWPMTWEAAHEYVRELDAREHGGLTGWRLPTVAELCSLIKPATRRSHYCLPEVFDPHRRWLWSADTKSFVAAWYADTTAGFIAWQDFTCLFHVRSVCSVSKQAAEGLARQGRAG